MKFEEALYNFLVTLTREVGDYNCVTKIGVTRRTWDYIVYHLAQDNKIGMTNFMNGALRIYDVEIVVRDKDGF